MRIAVSEMWKAVRLGPFELIGVEPDLIELAIALDCRGNQPFRK